MNNDFKYLIYEFMNLYISTLKLKKILRKFLEYLKQI